MINRGRESLKQGPGCFLFIKFRCTTSIGRRKPAYHGWECVAQRDSGAEQSPSPMINVTRSNTRKIRMGVKRGKNESACSTYFGGFSSSKLQFRMNETGRFLCLYVDSCCKVIRWYSLGGKIIFNRELNYYIML